MWLSEEEREKVLTDTLVGFLATVAYKLVSNEIKTMSNICTFPCLTHLQLHVFMFKISARFQVVFKISAFPLLQIIFNRSASATTPRSCTNYMRPSL